MFIAKVVLKIRAVKVERSKKTSILLVKRTFFSIVQLRRLVYAEPLVLGRNNVPHFKALICGYLEPKKLRARPPNKAATPSRTKLDLFHSKDRGGFVWGPSP